MSDIQTLPRTDQILDPGPPPEPAPEPAPPPPAPAAPPPPPPSRVGEPSRAGGDQLARIEDKAARIEEKFARQESTAQRVLDKLELASSRMGEVALQSEVAALRGELTVIARRTRALPGFAALMASSLVTAILTAIVVVALIRYMPVLVAR